MKDHISALSRSCFWQLRQLQFVRSSLTSDTAKTLVHAFISSRLDYCNSLLYGVSDSMLKKIQAFQNAAAWVVTGARKVDHITPVLRELHWLPVHQRIRYKLAMTVYRCPRIGADVLDWRLSCNLPLLASDTRGPLALSYCQYQLTKNKDHAGDE